MPLLGALRPVIEELELTATQANLAAVPRIGMSLIAIAIAPFSPVTLPNAGARDPPLPNAP